MRAGLLAARARWETVKAMTPAAAHTFSEQILQWTYEQWASLEDAAPATV
jgi:hypothetical protein